VFYTIEFGTFLYLKTKNGHIIKFRQCFPTKVPQNIVWGSVGNFEVNKYF